ncbi:hypothetical protein BT96DRAFT_997781 [Gymnopus androsaceus JB14]|uniref:Uncharacterized protein n=1 Tax=Gymnopus androsaceus JB14 TaxID=1447944 RepID=A0A6A4HAK9_9AGAR|nr:hypothetical protein BT96DRAFT_997781 [Gymnopus androsaceus JB14]
MSHPGYPSGWNTGQYQGYTGGPPHVFTPGPNIAFQGWLGPAYDSREQRNSGGPVPVSNTPGVPPRFPHYSQNNQNHSSRISDSDFHSQSNPSSGGRGYVQPHGYGIPVATPHAVRAFANEAPRPVDPSLPIPGGRTRRAPSHLDPISNGSNMSNSVVTHYSSDPNMYVVGHLSLESNNSNRSSRRNLLENLARHPEQFPTPPSSAATSPSRGEPPLKVTADCIMRCPKCKGIIYKSDKSNHECPNNENKKDKGNDKGMGSARLPEEALRSQLTVDCINIWKQVGTSLALRIALAGDLVGLVSDEFAMEIYEILLLKTVPEGMRTP